jgi:hypothetical protein
MFVWTVIREALYNYALELDSEILYDYKLEDPYISEEPCKSEEHYNLEPFTKKLPSKALRLISDYSKPVTRPDWKNGSLCAVIFKYSPIMVKTYYMLVRRIPHYGEYDNLCDLILNVGSDRVFQMYPYTMEYNNFYFYLLSDDNAFLQKKPVLKITGNFIYKKHFTHENYEYKIHSIKFKKQIV